MDTQVITLLLNGDYLTLDDAFKLCRASVPTRGTSRTPKVLFPSGAFRASMARQMTVTFGSKYSFFLLPEVKIYDDSITDHPVIVRHAPPETIIHLLKQVCARFELRYKSLMTGRIPPVLFVDKELKIVKYAFYSEDVEVSIRKVEDFFTVRVKSVTKNFYHCIRVSVSELEVKASIRNKDYARFGNPRYSLKEISAEFKPIYEFLSGIDWANTWQFREIGYSTSHLFVKTADGERLKEYIEDVIQRGNIPRGELESHLRLFLYKV